MLKRGFLASKTVFVSYDHKVKHVQEYLENVDQVFKMVKKTVKDDNVYNLLKGLVVHTGFKRLA